MTFERFLQLSVATNVPRLGDYDSVYTCRDNELDEDVRWIADGRVVSLHVRGDTADLAAVLTTVAHQIMDDVGEGYTATIRVREDTGHWWMVRSDGPGWKVCGEAKEHFGIMMLGRTIKWRPAGASEEKAHALIDSVRRSRGLPVAR